jgi:hypothetical protein
MPRAIVAASHTTTAVVNRNRPTFLMETGRKLTH